ncbi:13960_t:CDS:2 [Entrophospora sp. SA101]|nr:13960_t:CDS:2 [Entrophospora sp. SA101]
MENQSQPIGGLTFKDEIPELVQADTSTEGDTAEPRLIIPLTSGRDSRYRTAVDLILLNTKADISNISN